VLPRFEAWSETIAAIVAHAGFGDCCVKPDIAGARSDVVEMRDLIKKLRPDDDTEVEEWTFAMIMDEVQKHGLFAGLELPGKKGEREEMFTEAGEVTPAGRSFFGRFLVKFHERLFTGDDGERLRFLVEGKGNSRRYLVRRENPTDPPAPVAAAAAP
jgi:hypothetical protein